MTKESGAILVVEDEALIRMNLVQELEDMGFTVVEAKSADEALQLLDVHADITTIFTDIDMPGSINGVDLARTVRRSRPDVSITLTSGYLKISRSELPQNVGYISKPYDIDQVINQIGSNSLSTD